MRLPTSHYMLMYTKGNPAVSTASMPQSVVTAGSGHSTPNGSAVTFFMFWGTGGPSL